MTCRYWKSDLFHVCGGDRLNRAQKECRDLLKAQFGSTTGEREMLKFRLLKCFPPRSVWILPWKFSRLRRNQRPLATSPHPGRNERWSITNCDLHSKYTVAEFQVATRRFKDKSQGYDCFRTRSCQILTYRKDSRADSNRTFKSHDFFFYHSHLC